MARMFGKIKHTWFNSCRRGCCLADTNKTSVKREELKLSLTDAEDEMSHPIGKVCGDPFNCKECGYEDLDDAYDNADLDEIENVTCDVDWRV